jgi:Spy/CpxP family protein refolding chaperone
MFWRVVLTAAMAAAMAFAQEGGGMGGGMPGGGMGGMGSGGGMGGRGGGGGGGMGGMGGGMRSQPKQPLDLFAEKLKLNNDQKVEVNTILEAASKEVAPVSQQMLQARQNLAGVLINGQTGDAVDQLVKAYASLAAKNAAIEAKAFAQICKMLKPNQQKNAGQAFQLLAQAFDRPRMGGGRGGSRRGGEGRDR